jgi:hypothetical protein
MSGFDLPLKTNLEMVRIFKQLNGTVNARATWPEDAHLPKVTTKIIRKTKWK